MQEKLKLKLDDIQVESFDTGAVVGPRGTVNGASGFVWESCLQGNCCGEPDTRIEYCLETYTSVVETNIWRCDPTQDYGPCGYTVPGSCDTVWDANCSGPACTINTGFCVESNNNCTSHEGINCIECNTLVGC